MAEEGRKIYENRVIRCGNPRCNPRRDGTYIATLRILVDASKVYVPAQTPEAVGGGISIAEVVNIKCPRCGMKTDIDISFGISTQKPQELGSGDKKEG